jgi:restriction endonuclease S subunit
MVSIFVCIVIMRYNLFEIADVFTGHTLREKMEHDPEGKYSLIQLKDLSFTPNVNIKHPPFKISSQDVPRKQILKSGDILLLTKGSTNKALLYERQYEPALAVSAFTIIRLHTDCLKPEFLAWYINSAEAQEYFNVHRAGTTTLNLSKKAIDELSVHIPALEKQELMMKLVTQYELYKSLTAEYENNIRLLVENTLHNHLNEQ